LTHTHVSWYRDAEFRDHTVAFRPYFAEDMTMSYPVPKAPSLGDVATGAILYTTNPPNEADAARIIIDPGRSMPWHGTPTPGIEVVEYVNEAGAHSGKAYFVKAAQLTNRRAVPVPVVPPPVPCPPVPDPIEARRAQYDVDARAVLGPRP
jgi:hypothetical protein